MVYELYLDKAFFSKNKQILKAGVYTKVMKIEDAEMKNYLIILTGG